MLSLQRSYLVKQPRPHVTVASWDLCSIWQAYIVPCRKCMHIFNDTWCVWGIHDHHNVQQPTQTFIAVALKRAGRLHNFPSTHGAVGCSTCTTRFDVSLRQHCCVVARSLTCRQVVSHPRATVGALLLHSWQLGGAHGCNRARAVCGGSQQQSAGFTSSHWQRAAEVCMDTMVVGKPTDLQERRSVCRSSSLSTAALGRAPLRRTRNFPSIACQSPAGFTSPTDPRHHNTCNNYVTGSVSQAAAHLTAMSQYDTVS